VLYRLIARDIYGLENSVCADGVSLHSNTDKQSTASSVQIIYYLHCTVFFHVNRNKHFLNEIH